MLESIYCTMCPTKYIFTTLEELNNYINNTNKNPHLYCCGCRKCTLDKDKYEYIKGIKKRYKKKPIIRRIANIIDIDMMTIAYEEGVFSREEFKRFYKDMGYSVCGFKEIWGEEE